MELPAQFGKYRLEKFLGGGMSHVYAATDTVLQRPVAVKILTDDGCRDHDAKRRFLLEAQMCGSITHDNIIRVHDYGEHSGRPYIVMELLAGEDLRAAIDNHHLGGLPAKLRIALQAARALGHIHGLNIIHRDIKPENLHLDQSGRLRLMDFGIAKTANMSLTRTGFAVGTPYYMAPEQLMGKPTTHSVDIYAFGIVLYEMLAGVKPLTGETVESLFYLILQQPLNLEPLQKAGVPQPLIDLVNRCASKKPEERPPSFTFLIDELERLLEQNDPTYVRRATTGRLDTLFTASPGLAPSPGPPSPPKAIPWAPVAGGIALVLAVAAAAIYPMRAPKVEEKPPVAQKPKLDRVIRNGFGEMVLVPEGKYLSGADNAAKELPAFYIDKTEVSVAMWNQYSKEMGKPERVNIAEELPVTDVTFDEATAYCGWAGKRLPSGDEWEKAARGEDGRKYPWGNAEEAGRANVQGNTAVAEGQLQPVDSLREGASPLAALQMAGNAWEWVRQEGHPSAAFRERVKERMRNARFAPLTDEDVWFVMRGGGFDFGLPGAVTWETLPMPGRFKGPAIGFRCARSAP